LLSDYERKTLREIQRQLNIDDPEFERSFRALEESTPEPPTRLRRVYTVVIVISALLGVVMGLAGSVGGALAFAIIAASAWFARRCLNGNGHRRGD
jgi:hypothetical protein